MFAIYHSSLVFRCHQPLATAGWRGPNAWKSRSDPMSTSYTQRCR